MSETTLILTQAIASAAVLFGIGFITGHRLARRRRPHSWSRGGEGTTICRERI